MSNLKVIGNTEKKGKVILAIPGNLTTPYIYSQVETKSNYQFGVLDYLNETSPCTIENVAHRLEDYIDSMEFEKVILTGYSTGGVIAMYLASKRPELINGLLLSNTGLNTEGHKDPKVPQKIINEWDSNEFRHEFLSRCFNRDIPPVLKTQLLDYIDTIDNRRAHELAVSLRESDYFDMFKSVKCSIIIGHGKYDKTRTKEHAIKIKEAAPHSELRFLDGGHTIMIEDKSGWQSCLYDLIDLVEREEM